MHSLALIPYFEQPVVDLGFTRIYAWGLLVASGFLLGAWHAARMAQRAGLVPQHVLDYALWAFVSGFVGAHFLHVVAYEPTQLEEHGLWAFVRIWDGVSSFGGFLGATLGTVAFLRLRRIRWRDYVDPIAFGMALAWAIGRIGCFVAHDHIGMRSHFFLAVDFPPGPTGGPRHDLGLYDSLLTWFLYAVMRWVARSNPGRGTIAGLLCTGYAIGRFGLDFLRAFDARYLGLTPAQWGCFALFGYGVWLLVSARTQPPLWPRLDQAEG